MEWTWKDVVTAVVAVYGAVLSTFNLVSAFQDRRLRLKVDMTDGVAVGPGPLRGRQLRIATTNIGRRPVTLTQCSLQVKGQKSYLLMNNAMSALPEEITEGQFHAFAQPVEPLFEDDQSSKDSLTLRAIWYDSTGKSFHGRWVTIKRNDYTPSAP